MTYPESYIIKYTTYTKREGDLVPEKACQKRKQDVFWRPLPAGGFRKSNSEPGLRVDARAESENMTFFGLRLRQEVSGRGEASEAVREKAVRSAQAELKRQVLFLALGLDGLELMIQGIRFRSFIEFRIKETRFRVFRVEC